LANRRSRQTRLQSCRAVAQVDEAQTVPQIVLQILLIPASLVEDPQTIIPNRFYRRQLTATIVSHDKMWGDRQSIGTSWSQRYVHPDILRAYAHLFHTKCLPTLYRARWPLCAITHTENPRETDTQKAQEIVGSRLPFLPIQTTFVC
jgi:hypothetical protein